MKLYYAAGACSLSPHIVALEAGIAVELEKVDTKAKRTASGEDYWQINPKGYVPALQLDNGELLTEGTAIVQYLADLKPESGLAPANGTTARYRLQETLGYINSELHKSYTPLFKPDTPDAVRDERKDYLRKRYALLDQHLAKHDWLIGEQFTAADAYLFTVTNWAQHVSLDLSDFPAILAFQQRVSSRPQVQSALKAEGLLKAA
ncbi:glutathione transferase GstA [Dyella kyungheensis]|jgi:glutathione S-transferase|uniref:Glutathione transferase GstA n=1 Tax=Dyella kyungheensis TaxID=1242174 RepID=A0ABS2JTI0_9GAMM|nr:glutathione transferase GstA [Dyella kyungheensis]MBM7121752.1 glutathione transferase GstA [Dyella kyungheensis]